MELEKTVALTLQSTAGSDIDRPFRGSTCKEVYDMRSITTLDLQYAHRFYGFKGEAQYLHGPAVTSRVRPVFLQEVASGSSRL